jgi:hypothetical protein
MLAVALIASLAGGGGAAASLGNDPSAVHGNAIVPETSITPVMELPSGCGGDDWSFDSSID